MPVEKAQAVESQIRRLVPFSWSEGSLDVKLEIKLIGNPRYGRGEVKRDAQGKWRFFYQSLLGYVGTDQITFITIDPFCKESDVAAIDINVVRVGGPSARVGSGGAPSGGGS